MVKGWKDEKRFHAVADRHLVIFDPLLNRGELIEVTKNV